VAGAQVTAAGWGELLVVTALVAGLPGAYALRRRATLPGLVALASVTYLLFALWFFLSLNYVLQLLDGALTTLWPAVFVLVGVAVADLAATWIGWRWHRKSFRSQPTGERPAPADGGYSGN
jgi:hypothetical protein